MNDLTLALTLSLDLNPALNPVQVDLFLYGLDRDASVDALRQIDAHIAENYEGDYERTSSAAAVTFTKKKHDAASSIDEKQRNRPFQIILGLHRSRSQILEYFDLAPCKSLARHDPESEELIVEALPIFIHSLSRMAFHVDIMFWSPASVARIMKYVAKGFECVVPGIRRSAFKTETANRSLHYSLWTRYGHNKGGIRALFDAEAEVINSRAYWSQPNEVLKCKGEMVFGDKLVIEKITGRLKLVEAATIASMVLNATHACHTWTLAEHTTYQNFPMHAPYMHTTADHLARHLTQMAGRLGCGRDKKAETATPQPYGHSDDEDAWSFFDGYGVRQGTNTYGFIRESFRQDVAVRLGDARRDIGLDVKFWTFTDAGRFQPSKAYMEELYNMDELLRVAEQEVAERASAVQAMHEEEDIDESANSDDSEEEDGETKEYTDDSDSSDEENNDEEEGNEPLKTDTPVRGNGEWYWTPTVWL